MLVIAIDVGGPEKIGWASSIGRSGTGSDLDGALREVADALNDFAWELGGTEDIHATAAYRRELVRRLGRQVIEEARGCAN